MSGPNDKDSSWPSGYDYIDSAGGLHDNAHDAIEANQGYEGAWGTGVGCGQEADNVGDSGDSEGH